MGVFEQLIDGISQIHTKVEKLNKKISELEGKQDNEEVWQRKDLEDFTKFKYANIKELTSNSNFPKFYIGKTECYLKSEVIVYLKKRSIEEKENRVVQIRKNGKSSLYA